MSSDPVILEGKSNVSIFSINMISMENVEGSKMTTKLSREETVVFITGHLPLGFLSRNTVAAAETQSCSWHKNERSSRSSSRPCSQSAWLSGRGSDTGCFS